MLMKIDRSFNKPNIALEMRRNRMGCLKSDLSQRHQLGIISNFVHSQFPSLFAVKDVSECEIRCQWV